MQRAWRRSEKMIDFTRCRNAQVVERMTEDDYLQKQGFEVRGKAEYFMHRNFAHRGLHDMDRSIPENSLMAFAAAVGEGYGIELDVQLSKDGQVVVFHDDTLNRVCGVDGRVDAYDYDELKEFSLLGTMQHIPLFTEALELIGTGDGPLIVELKSGSRNSELCEKTYNILRQYQGKYCIESFNPFIVRWFKQNVPEVFRGLLAASKEEYMPTYPALIAKLLSNCTLGFLCKPDFIAYQNVERPKQVLRMREKGTLLFAWTSRVPDVDQAQNDAVIFENYRPSLLF